MLNPTQLIWQGGEDELYIPKKSEEHAVYPTIYQIKYINNKLCKIIFK